MAKLVDSIPVAAREELETCLNKDLRGAIVTDACKPGAGTDAQNDTFDYIIVAAAEHAAREAGLPGRADRMIACRSCGAPTASSDGICRDCAEALRVERAAALGERCRVHRVRRVEDLPVSVLQEMQAEWGRC